MSIHFEGKTFELLPDETVLEGIERHGMSVASFCRKGVCQACLVKARRGAVPLAAQKGLKDGLKRQGLFLACVCRPEGDLQLERRDGAEKFSSRVAHVEPLSEAVLRVGLTCPAGLEYEAGQFLQLERPGDGLTRPYSIASLPGSGLLELHVALLPGGEMSGWLRTAIDQPVALSGPFGECSYLPDEPERPLLLAGTGTGLAPLLGVLRAALAAGHRGPMRLYHGSLDASGLYLWPELRSLVDRHARLDIHGSVLTPSAGFAESSAARARIRVAPLEDLVLGDAGPLQDERIYLCGHPELVRKLQKKLFLAGASLQRIHSDPFVAPAARA